MPYIPFTEEQKRTANQIDLVEFLRSRGERLISSGSEMRMVSDHSVTIRGNKWYDHATRQGGGPVDFLQTHLGMNYQDAMLALLGGCSATPPLPAARLSEREVEKPFKLPKANKDMRRVFAYLTKARGIDSKVISAFAKQELIYEDAEHHNIVFVGRDSDGTPRHAHLRSTQSFWKTFRINESGSQPRCSFHWLGQGDALYVFEAPIDLLSYISLNQDGWEDSSYVALCGLSEKPILWLLEQYTHLKQVRLCLDNDQAGIDAVRRITETLTEKGYSDVRAVLSLHKDWNDDLKAAKGILLQPRQLDEAALDGLLGDVSLKKGKSAHHKIPALLGQRDRFLQLGYTDKANGCLREAASYAVSAAMLEYHQMERELRAEDITTYIRQAFNTAGSGDHTAKDLAEIQAKSRGVHTEEEKRQLMESWLTFAAQCLSAVQPEQKLQRTGGPSPVMEM